MSDINGFPWTRRDFTRMSLPYSIRSPFVTLAGATLMAVGIAACAGPEGGRGPECIAPANAGGGWDLTCRLTAQILESLELVPGRMRTINLPGAGGGIAFAHAVGQRADDPNVLVAASPATTLRLAQGQYGHLTAEDVRWVAAIGAEYGIVAVANDAPWQDLPALLDAWKADPSSIVVSGGSSVAGQDHMKMLLLARAAGIEPRAVRYVAFDGGGEALTALLGGFVQVFSGEASEVLSQLETGDIRLLAVLAPDRLGGLLGTVPTATEQGFPVNWVTWRGFYVPADVGDEAYNRWASALRSVGESEAWEGARERSRLQPFLLVGAEFEQFVSEQVDDFQSLARDLGLVR
jgi:putative tricarboxylic transport membrane protein